MPAVGQRIGQHRLDDFVQVSKVAEELGVHPSTVKRWLKNGTVKGVTWGRDRRGWIHVQRDSVGLLKTYRDSVHLE